MWRFLMQGYIFSATFAIIDVIFPVTFNYFNAFSQRRRNIIVGVAGVIQVLVLGKGVGVHSNAVEIFHLVDILLPFHPDFKVAFVTL